MIDRLEVILSKYNEIQEKLQSGNLQVKEMTDLLKESSEYQGTVELFLSYKKNLETIKDLEELYKSETDNEFKVLYKDELDEAGELAEKQIDELKILLLPKDPNDNKNVIVEIKGAAGGDEGNIFAGDLYRMYSKYSEEHNWKIDVLNASHSDSGGFTSIEFMIKGNNVYSMLKHESGVHRVQRVPQTESQGRIHTSTAVVLVMPEADEIDIEVKWEDIRFDTYNSSGPGGQSVNTTKSAVRLTHIPTGLVAAIQDGKSQHENKESAFRLLKARIYDKFLQEQLEKEGNLRKSIVGTGSRSEKIRTYNYPQNRITDHRIGLTVQRLDAVLEGKIDLILEPLLNEIQKRQLAGE